MTAKRLHNLENIRDPVNSNWIFNNNETKIAMTPRGFDGGYLGTIDLDSGEKNTLGGFVNRVSGMAWSPNGKTIALNDSGLIRLYDVGKSREIPVVSPQMTGFGNSSPEELGFGNSPGSTMTFSPDSRYLVCCGEDGVKTYLLTGTVYREVPIVQHKLVGVKFLRTAASGYLKHKQVRDNFIRVAVSPDGQTIAAGTSVGNIYLWDFETGSLRTILQSHNSPISSLTFSPDGRFLASSNPNESIMTIWDVDLESYWLQLEKIVSKYPAEEEAARNAGVDAMLAKAAEEGAASAQGSETDIERAKYEKAAVDYTLGNAKLGMSLADFRSNNPRADHKAANNGSPSFKRIGKYIAVLNATPNEYSSVVCTFVDEILIRMVATYSSTVLGNQGTGRLVKGIVEKLGAQASTESKMPWYSQQKQGSRTHVIFNFEKANRRIVMTLQPETASAYILLQVTDIKAEKIMKSRE